MTHCSFGGSFMVDDAVAAFAILTLTDVPGLALGAGPTTVEAVAVDTDDLRIVVSRIL